MKEKGEASPTDLTVWCTLNYQCMFFLFLLLKKNFGLRQGGHLFVGCPERVKPAVLLLAAFRTAPELNCTFYSKIKKVVLRVSMFHYEQMYMIWSSSGQMKILSLTQGVSEHMGKCSGHSDSRYINVV